MSDYDDIVMTPAQGSETGSSAQLGHTAQPTLQGLQNQINALSSQLERLFAVLQSTQQQPVAPEPAPPIQPSSEPTQPNPVPVQPTATAPAEARKDDFSSLTVKELAKQSLNLAEKQRLVGPENYQQWFQAISIQFRALQIPEFLDNPSLVSSRLSDPQRTALLLTLRNTLREGPLETIAFETNPAVTYSRLKQ
jgi:hypothetical protein